MSSISTLLLNRVQLRVGIFILIIKMYIILLPSNDALRSSGLFIGLRKKVFHPSGSMAFRHTLHTTEIFPSVKCYFPFNAIFHLRVILFHEIRPTLLFRFQNNIMFGFSCVSGPLIMSTRTSDVRTQQKRTCCFLNFSQS